MSDGIPPPDRTPSEPPAPPPPYGQAPYGQPPYGQPPYGQDPYAQPPYGQAPYAAPYGQAPFAAAYGQVVDPDRRPGTVTAGGLIAILTSGLSAVLTGLGIIGLLAARNDFLDAVRDDPDFQASGLSADSLFGVVMGVLVFAVVCSLVGCLLGFLVLRRSNVARILLVISAGIVAVVSLAGIASILPVLWLAASAATVVLMFTGGANQWFAGRGTQGYPASPGPTQQPW